MKTGRVLKMLGVVVTLALGGCLHASYGARTDGIFPSRSSSGTYPNWEYMCLIFNSLSATEILNDAGSKGWELVTMGTQGGDSLICFKRAKS